MSSVVPPGYGRGGVPVRHRHVHTSSSPQGRQTDASRTGGGHELPLFYGRPVKGRKRRRGGRWLGGGRGGGMMAPSPRGREARRRAFLRRVLLTTVGGVLLVSYLRSGETGGEAELANSVEDFNDWKLLRADRKRRRQEQKNAHQNRLGQQNDEEWELPFVHIVNTRFMQSQGTLKTLGWARLYLFKAFCLSTMIHQTSQDFLWIIKTDPNLNGEILAALVEMLKPYPNYYLVGSEHNYLIGHESGAWRGGMEGADLLKSPIYSGDVNLLKLAHAVQNDRIVLESRLDADDGLVTGYLEYVQRTALEKFGAAEANEDDEDGALASKEKQNKQQQQERPKWMYWCSRQNAEWFADPTVDVGATNAVQHTLLCVTPGITIGFPVGTRYEEVKQFPHDRIIKELDKKSNGCGMTNSTDCINLVQAFPMMAVRSRTPTSAGMMGIRMDEKDALPEDKRLLLWKLLQSPKHFHIDADDVRVANRFIHQNIVEIAKDNLKGQCTPGHSCKLSSKEQLQRLTELALMWKKGESIDEPRLVVLEE